MNWISFPGLGIEPFGVDPTAFSLLGKNVAWYGIIICLGIVLSFLFARSRAKKYEGITDDSFIDLAIFLIPAAIIGARLYFVIFHGGYNSFSDIIAVWRGGLAIYGGLIAGLATVLIFSKIKKRNPMRYLDPIASSVFIGQAIGRWGNFVNAEAHGGPTELPWRMGISASENGEFAYYHPTFLYESLWNTIGFVIALFLYRKKRFSGQIFLLYISWYGLGRGFIELLRTDSLTVADGAVRVSSLLGFACFVGGTAVYIFLSLRAKKVELEAGEYENLFVDRETEESEESEETEQTEESQDLNI